MWKEKFRYFCFRSCFQTILLPSSFSLFFVSDVHTLPIIFACWGLKLALFAIEWPFLCLERLFMIIMWRNPHAFWIIINKLYDSTAHFVCARTVDMKETFFSSLYSHSHKRGLFDVFSIKIDPNEMRHTIYILYALKW